MGGRYNPWDDLAERYPGVHVERCACAPARGVWVPEERVILLARHLDRPERNSTLAHEIAHMDLAHRPVRHRHFAAIQERDADALAARRLIDIESLADALSWALCPEEVAVALDVELRMVRIRVRGLNDCDKVTIERRIAGKEDVA